jgi:putative endonuclease
MQPFVVYILYSSLLDKYYVGHIDEAEKRLLQHNLGLSTYTSKSPDWILVYKEVFLTRQEASKREKDIKAKKSRKYIEWLIRSAG